MEVQIPNEIANFFTKDNFSKYPVISLPQHFEDSRGTIINIADGKFGDVAVISSTKNSIRANHFHVKDWHLSYMISGEMEYSWKNSIEEDWQSLQVGKGMMIYTPPKVIHKMEFGKDSIFIAVSALSRTTINYEADTIRI